MIKKGQKKMGLSGFGFAKEDLGLFFLLWAQ
jgi:hypothetical protein